MKCVDRASGQGVVVGKQVVQYLVIGVSAVGHEGDDTGDVLIDGYALTGLGVALVVKPVEEACWDLPLVIAVNRDKLAFINKIPNPADGLVEIVRNLCDREDDFAGG
ncbi:hypothetical protein HMPREF1861_01293 [Corynebacterium kroppenstedtii]|nr:hypothetical protein HMPREF1861_01293 [Corynebacterium kroppenstedtii]